MLLGQKEADALQDVCFSRVETHVSAVKERQGRAHRSTLAAHQAHPPSYGEVPKQNVEGAIYKLNMQIIEHMRLADINHHH